MPQIGLVVVPGFQCLALGAQTAFEIANTVIGEDFYSVHLLSLDGGMVPSSTGFRVETIALGAMPGLDTLMLLAGTEPPAPLSARQVSDLQHHIRQARRVAGLCIGAFLLAQCGVLDGRRATTHWIFAQMMRQQFPAVTVEEDRIFINEGPIWTSAGMTAGLDLAVALVEKDLGADIARSVARKLVMHHRRAGGQSQHSELSELAAKSDRIQTALAYAKQNLAKPLSVETLAEAASLSPRQFSRTFRAETGQSPAKAIELLRLEMARLMLEDSRHPIDVVARETGFADARRMRESFMRQYGVPPQTVRRQARTAA
jgi:transcriptional regulator GlxA family with amidase domain